MIFHRLVLRINESLIARLYKAKRENARLRKELYLSRKQKKVLEQMMHKSVQSLVQKLNEGNMQWSDVLRKCAIQSEQIAKLQEMASRDPLTDLLNRRGLEKAIHRQTSLIQRYTQDNATAFHPPHMILLDLDKFKEINDTYGHPKGDEVLLTVTKILQEVFHRDTDIICRTGGDEFLIFLSNSTHDQAVMSAELLRRGIEMEDQLHFPEHSVTASIGVTECSIMQNTKPYEMDDICQKAQKLADQAMYHSKKEGKNVVTVAIGNVLCIL